MKKYTLRTVSGVSTVAIAAGTIGSALLSISSASAATVALPTCDAAISDVATTTSLAAYNASKTSVYKSTPAYKLLKKKVADATASLKKANATKASTKAAKTAKAKKVATATKALNTAKSNESKGLKSVVVNSFSGTAIPSAVPATSSSSARGNWTFGQYTTRVFVRNGTMIDACYSVDESNEFAQNDLNPVSYMTEEDKATSLTYQYGDIDLLPSLRTEALKSPAKSRTAINQNLVSWLQGLDDTITEIGANSGCTYTVQGFQQSLQAALVAAKLPA
jgi:hypothetical protein